MTGLMRFIALLGILIIPIGVGALLNEYHQYLVCYVLIWAIMAVSWNMFCGYTGLISFGHAMYWGIGAFALGIGIGTFDMPTPLAMLLGVALAVAASLLVGLPTLRLKGAYFSLAMLAYPLVTMSLITWLGFREIFLPLDQAGWWNLRFDNTLHYIALSAFALTAALAVNLWLHSHRLGNCLQAIRQNEPAAEASGIDTWRCKLVANVISAAIAAVAGSLYALVLGVLTSDNAFGFMVSAQAVVLSLFGGVASPWGPVIGAGILVPAAEWLQAEFGAELPGISGLLYGLALIAVVLAAPEWIYWKARDLIRRRRAPPVASPSADVERRETEAALLAPASPAISRAAGLALETIDLSLSFGGVRALDNVKVEIERQTIHCIVGPNGAGKTTLFNVLNGFLRPDRGAAFVGGAPVIGKLPHQVCKLGVARTFQVPRVFPRMTAVENVLIGAYATTHEPKMAVRIAHAALERVGLAPRSHDLVRHLTTHEIRLLEIARGLAGKPNLFLMDEVLAGVGKAEAQAIESLLIDLRSNGITIAIIEHTMESMLRIADEFTVLDYGRTITKGVPHQVIRRPEVIKAYLGEKWAEHA